MNSVWTVVCLALRLCELRLSDVCYSSPANIFQWRCLFSFQKLCEPSDAWISYVFMLASGHTYVKTLLGIMHDEFAETFKNKCSVVCKGPQSSWRANNTLMEPTVFTYGAKNSQWLDSIKTVSNTRPQPCICPHAKFTRTQSLAERQQTLINTTVFT